MKKVKDPILPLYKLSLEKGKFKEKLVKRGRMETLNKWAKSKGLKFKSDSSLFGGYYVAKDGTAYSFRKQL